MPVERYKICAALPLGLNDGKVESEKVMVIELVDEERVSRFPQGDVA